MPLITPSATSPNIGNLSVKRGYMSAQFEGETAFTDMGFALSADLHMNPKLLHYMSSREGIRKKVLSVVTELDATLNLVLNEQTARNMGLAVLSLTGTSSTLGGTRLDFMSNPRFYVSLKFTDTSTYGPKWMATIPLALMTPKQGIALIAQGSGDWANVHLQCDVQFSTDDNSFGWIESPDL